jgi:hypothetical protein
MKPSEGPARCDKCSHKLSNHKPRAKGKYAKINGVKFHCTLPLSLLGPMCGCVLTEDEIKIRSYTALS